MISRKLRSFALKTCFALRSELDFHVNNTSELSFEKFLQKSEKYFEV